jgi:hypothetical protein
MNEFATIEFNSTQCKNDKCQANVNLLDAATLSKKLEYLPENLSAEIMGLIE